MNLNEIMNLKFNTEEKRVLRILGWTHYESNNSWSLNSGELFVAETQLGYSKEKTKKTIINALHIFDTHDVNEVKIWLGY